MKTLGTGTQGSVWLLPVAEDEWSDLDDDDQVAIEARASALCNADRPLAKEKFRKVEGVSGAVYELKTHDPPLRAMCHRISGGWVVSLIVVKPKKRKVAKEAERALDRFAAWNDEHKKE